MSQIAAIFTTTLRQLLGKKRLIGFSLLSLVPALILYIATRAEGVEDLPEIFAALVVAPLLAIVIPVTTLILAGSALGDEVADKTLSFLVLRPVSRVGIAAAKTGGAAVAAVGFAWLGVMAIVGLYAALGGSLSVAPAVLAGATIACVVYSAAFVLLGHLSQRATLFGLLYVFLLENGLMSALPRLAALSPWRIGLAATSDLLPEGVTGMPFDEVMGSLPADAWSALIRSGVVIAVAVVSLSWLLSRRDAA